MDFEEFATNEDGSDDELKWNDAEDDENGNGLTDDDSTENEESHIGTKRKFTQNDGGSKPKKIRSERKVAPPTAEEMIHLRETETLFKSNLFRLEIEEMLKEIKPLKSFKTAATLWVDSFRNMFKRINEDEDWTSLSEVNVLNDLGLCLPLPDLGKSYSGHYKFLKPTEVKMIGSVNVGCSMGPKFNVDVAVVSPKAVFRKKDYLNQTYHYKRALYLCSIAAHLKNSTLVSEISSMKFTRMNGDNLKPILVVNPSGKLEGKIEMLIHVVPEEGTIKLSRFSPSSNNVRKSWWGCGSMVSELTGTPWYNTSITEDIVLESNERIREEAFRDWDNMKEAICLLRVWLRQRNFDQGLGSFSTYIMSMVLVYLKDKQKINKYMSSYQVIRNVWLYLSQSNWCERGESMCKAEPGDVPAMSVFHGYFDVVFIDPSGYLNITARMNKLTYLKVRSESVKAVELLDTTEVNGFHALFMVKMLFIHQYDHLVSFNQEDVITEAVHNNTSSGSDVDFNGDAVPMFTKLVGDLLTRGLGERASEIGLMPIECCRWDIDASPSPLSGCVVFGIKLHSDHALNIVDKGPSPNSSEGAEFREFWTSKSELRRFKDGLICECVVWDEASLPISKRIGITKKVVTFLLESKLGIKSDGFIYVADQLDYIISSKMHDVTAEEISLKVHKSLEELSCHLIELKDLPLDISSVQCISSSYRYTDIFPPIPPPKPRFKTKRPECPLFQRLFLDENLTEAPPFVPTIDLVIQMTLTRRWPDDLAACRRLTAAFYIAIAKQLQNKHNLNFIVHTDCLLVQKDGFMFRLFLGYSKEISLLKLKMTEDNVKQYKDTLESIKLEKNFVNLPQITGALHGLSVAEVGFGGGARLSKRWISSHMLDSYHFPPIVTELMVASLFLRPQPYSTVLQPQQIFLRFLNMLATTNWHTEPLIVNFNNLLSKDELREIEKKFEKSRSSLPPLVVVTPYDRSGTIWTKQVPTLSTLVRLAKLSAATLKIFQENLLYSNPNYQYSFIFSPNMKLYDVILDIDDKMVPRKCESVEFKNNHSKFKNQSHDDNRFMILPATNFDPPVLYLNYLRENYEEFALFFHDPYGGSKIGVLFKPSVFDASEFKVNKMGGRCPNFDDEPISLKTNFKSIINDFKEAGRGLLKNIILSDKMKTII